MTSAEMWLVTVVTQLVCALLLSLLTCVSGGRLYQEYQIHQNLRISLRNSSFSRRNRSNSEKMTPVSPSTLNDDGYHTEDPDQFPEMDVNDMKPAADAKRDNYRSNKKAKNHEFVVILSLKIFSVCLSYLIVSMNASLSLTGIVSCSFRNITNGLFWTVGKATTLSIFVDRIGSVYRRSVYQYSVTTQRVLYTLIMSTQLVFISLWLFLSESFTSNVKGINIGQVCSASTKYRLIPVAALFCELTIELVTLKMFTSPLRKLCSLGRRMDDQTLAMAKLAQKTTVLTYVMVIITLVTLLIIIVSGNYLANPPYLVIFCLCLLLFPHWFDDYYPILCAVPIVISDQCCALPDYSVSEQQTDRPRHSSVSIDSSKRRADFMN